MNPRYDMHVHVWQGQFEDFVVGTRRGGATDQLALLLALMDRFNIEKSCVVGACGDGHTGNNDFVADVCRKYSDRFVMFAEIPVPSPSRNEMLERTLSKWPARGIRYCAAADETPCAWQGEAYAEFWSQLDEADLCVALNLSPPQIAGLEPLVAKWPRIRWILDHMGRPRHDMTDAEYKPVLDLAGHPNVYVKVSAFYAFTERAAEYPYTDLRRFVLALRDAYGAARLLWGSDTPPALEFGSYEQTFACLNHIDELDDSDLEWLFGKTAEQLLENR